MMQSMVGQKCDEPRHIARFPGESSGELFWCCGYLTASRIVGLGYLAASTSKFGTYLPACIFERDNDEAAAGRRRNASLRESLQRRKPSPNNACRSASDVGRCRPEKDETSLMMMDVDRRRPASGSCGHEGSLLWICAQ